MVASVKEQPLSQQAFERARNLAKQRYVQLREKHPTLQAYLVLSSPIGQVAHETTIDDILKGFPEMILDGKAKEEFVRFSKSPKPKDPSPKKLEQWRRKNDELVSPLEIDGSVQVELRFIHLDYELIPQLQKDSLVDSQLTPQSRASIRIVLGTLSQLSR